MPKGVDSITSNGPHIVEAVEFLFDAVYGPAPAIEEAKWPMISQDNDLRNDE